MKEEIKTYAIGKSVTSGLELELQYMPSFFSNRGKNPMQPHAHKFYQIIWFKRGHGMHYVDFTAYPVSDNTLFFIAPNQIHTFDGAKDYEGVIIQFNANFLADEQSSESIFLKYNVFNAYDALPYYKVSNDEAKRLDAIVRDMQRELSLVGAFAHSDYMQSLVHLFLIRMQRSGERKDHSPLYVTSNAHCTFVRFRQLIEQYFRMKHTVSEYADMLNVSTRSLTNYVGQCSCQSPLQMINERIVLEAKRMLQHSPMSIKEIAHTLGFNDPSYFVKLFKRLAGEMPSTFRNKQSQYMKQKIAVPTSNGTLFPHFGKAPQVTIYDVDNKQVTGKNILTSPEHAHGAMPRFLHEQGVTDVVCGGLGAGAVKLLDELHINVHGGAPAIATDELINLFLADKLEYGDATCHHDACDGKHEHHHA